MAPGRASQVVAIEPDERMRAVLAQRSPGVRVLAGWGERMPLPDGCADAVFVSTAWHWLEPERAVPEIARVLRSGGRLGVIWTSRDREHDWVAELDLLRLPGISGPDADSQVPRTLDDVRAQLDRDHSVALPDGAEFGDVETASFRFTRSIAIGDAVEWLAGRPEAQPFHYHDLGSAAYISRGSAVMSAGNVHLSGFIGWWGWLFIHIAFMTGFRNRLGAVLSWWFAFTRDLRQERTFTSGQVGQVADVYTARPPAPDPQRDPQRKPA